MRIAVIGTGNMSTALITGMRSQAPDLEVVATTRSEASAARLRQTFGAAGQPARAGNDNEQDTAAEVRVTSLETDPEANRLAAADADFVFLGVKPWLAADTLTEIADALGDSTVLVSMLAGTQLDTLASYVPNVPVVRIMPNTPCSIGHGVIAFAAEPTVPKQAAQQLRELLDGAGLVVQMPEDDIHAMTAISGSGVAYYFLLTEALTQAGTTLGLSEDVARQIAVGTADGAGRLLQDHGDPSALRQAVTSKNGTTDAALTSFAKDDFAAIVQRAARAADARSRQLAAGK